VLYHPDRPEDIPKLVAAANPEGDPHEVLVLPHDLSLDMWRQRADRQYGRIRDEDES